MLGGALVSLVKRWFGRAAACKSDDDDEATSSETTGDRNGNVAAAAAATSAAPHCRLRPRPAATTAVLVCRRCGGAVPPPPTTSSRRPPGSDVAAAPSRGPAADMEVCRCRSTFHARQLPRCRHSTDACGPRHVRCSRVSKKGKVFPYSLPSVGPGADPGVQAVSPQVT